MSWYQASAWQAHEWACLLPGDLDYQVESALFVLNDDFHDPSPARGEDLGHGTFLQLMMELAQDEIDTRQELDSVPQDWLGDMLCFVYSQAFRDACEAFYEQLRAPFVRHLGGLERQLQFLPETELLCDSGLFTLKPYEAAASLVGASARQPV